MRAISAFSLEAGTSTLGWRAWIALRTRVSMSAMGSLVIVLLLLNAFPLSEAGWRRSLERPFFLPARLRHARNLTVQRELAEAQTADAEFAQKSAWAPASPAAVAVPALKFRRLFPPFNVQLQILGNLCGGGHYLKSCSLSLAVASPRSREPHCCRNGIPICLSRASPSASVRAVVVMEMFIPLVLSTLE